MNKITSKYKSQLFCSLRYRARIPLELAIEQHIKGSSAAKSDRVFIQAGHKLWLETGKAVKIVEIVIAHSLSWYACQWLG